MPTATTVDSALVTLPAMEVFRAGDYGDRGCFSEQELQTIASRYSADKHHAPCTIDHEKRGPAYGWVKSVFARGRSLFAVPEVLPEFAEAIKKRQFPKRSVEFYSEFGEEGGRYLKRLTFLGAKIPEVKGMADPEFAEGASTVIEFDAAEGADASFEEEPPHPADAKHGPIVKQIGSTTVLEHWHTLYVDAEGNGYTGPPMHYDRDYRAERVPNDSHQHLVEGGRIQPAQTGAGWNVEHVHGDFDFSESTSGDRTMTTKIPKAGAPDAEMQDRENKGGKSALDPQFAELEAENARLRKDVDAMKAQRADAEFEEAFKGAVGRGAIVPAAKANAKVVFDQLRKSTGDVEFSEDGKTVKGAASDAFLGFLRTLAAPPPFGSMVETDGDKNPLTRRPASEFSDQEKADAEFAEVEKLMAANPKLTFEEAGKAVRSKAKK